MSRSTRTPARGLARLLVTTVVAGAVTVGVAGTASADSGAAAPPAMAYIDPAPSGAPAIGDGGQDYWADDNCHYFARDGFWHSDMCMFALADASGNVIPGLYADFQNLGGGEPGREVLRIDLSMPGYVAFAPVTDVVGTWVRMPVGDPLHYEVLGSTIDGAPVWVTYVIPPAAQSGTPDLSYNTSPAGQAYWQLLAKINQTATDNMEDIIGIKIDPYGS